MGFSQNGKTRNQIKDIIKNGQNQKQGNIQLLHSLIVLSIPTVLEEVLSTLLQYVDTAMVGRLGERATAAVSVTTTVNWLVSSIFLAVGVAVLAMISRAFGSRDEEQLRNFSKQTLLLATCCGILVGGAAIFLSPYIPIWMGAEKAVQKNASSYFFIISLPMIFRAYTIILGAAIRGTQNTRTPMLINMAANGLNMILNYIFIYSLKLGVNGAAIASALSYSLCGLLMLRAYRKNHLLYWKWKEYTVDVSALKECARIGLPVLGANMASCLGYVVFAGLVSGMGTTIFVAHSIAVTAETLFYIPGYGLRTSTSAMIGAALGEKNQRKMKQLGTLSVLLTIGLMCFSGLILYISAYPLMCLFTNSRRVALLGAEMLRLVALSEPFFGLMVVLEGIFYGIAYTRYVFLVETFSMWGIRILFTFFCVRVWKLDLRAVWYCMIGDNVCKAVLFSMPFIIKRWREKLFKG